MGQGHMARAATASGAVVNGGDFRELSVGSASCHVEEPGLQLKRRKWTCQ